MLESTYVTEATCISPEEKWTDTLNECKYKNNQFWRQLILIVRISVKRLRTFCGFVKSSLILRVKVIWGKKGTFFFYFNLSGSLTSALLWPCLVDEDVRISGGGCIQWHIKSFDAPSFWRRAKNISASKSNRIDCGGEQTCQIFFAFLNT